MKNNTETENGRHFTLFQNYSIVDTMKTWRLIKKTKHKIFSEKRGKAVSLIIVNSMMKAGSIRLEWQSPNEDFRYFRLWDKILICNNRQLRWWKIETNNRNHQHIYPHSNMFLNNNQLSLLAHNFQCHHNYYHLHNSVSNLLNLLFQIHHWSEHPWLYLYHLQIHYPTANNCAHLHCRLW